jgi:hypothetical protein
VKETVMSSTNSRMSRRAAIRQFTATGLAAPMVFRRHASAAPSETVLHASFGASGMAGADIASLTASKYVKLVAVADVDLRNTAQIKKQFPDVRVYLDWRDLLDKEKLTENTWQEVVRPSVQKEREEQQTGEGERVG